MTVDQLLKLYPKSTYVIINRGKFPKKIKEIKSDTKNYIVIQDREVLDLDVDLFMDEFDLYKPYLFIRTKRV